MKKSLNILIWLIIFLVSIYIIRILKITGICCIFLSILSPLFFGYIISWIIKPIIDKFNINRVVSTLIIYILFLGLIIFMLFNIVPILIIEIKKIIPIIKYYILHNEILYNIYNNLNIKTLLSNTLKYFNNCFTNIFSILMNIIYTLIFGFYFLISKNKKSYFNFMPNKLRKSIDKDLRLYVKSILLDTLFIFIILLIAFKTIGLSSPIIFALFCSITNIIPYIGPYIGGIPAILIGLTTSINKGIIVLIVIIIVQIIENNIIQPLIVSKNVNLNPIIILIGIIVFSHFFGILGMIISTPILLVLRNVYNYYKKNKPNWFTLILDKQ